MRITWRGKQVNTKVAIMGSKIILFMTNQKSTRWLLPRLSQWFKCRSDLPLSREAIICQEPYGSPDWFLLLSPKGFFPYPLKLQKRQSFSGYVSWLSDCFLKWSLEIPCLIWMAVSRNQSFRQHWDLNPGVTQTVTNRAGPNLSDAEEHS